MRTATMHCVRWDQLLIVFQTRVRERPHSRFKTAFICEQRTIPVFAGKLKAISRVFLNVASCRCAKSTSPTTTSTCVSSYFFLHPVVIVYFETIFKGLKVVGSQIRFFHFNHRSLYRKVWFIFMTYHMLQWQENLNLNCERKKKKLLILYFELQL